MHSHNTEKRVPAYVRDVVAQLDAVTGGRISAAPGPENPWHVVKSSGLPGKSVTETPGLVVGDPDAPVRRIAVAMSVTEHDIELANAIGVDLIVAHHPLADAASSGGVPLSDYLPLYGVSVIECHEAFHGLHPGIGRLHGHAPFLHHGSYGGVPGKVVMVGRPLPGVATLGDVLDRVRRTLARPLDEEVLAAEARARGGIQLHDSVTAPGQRILHGTPRTPLGDKVIHAFPHTGFNAGDLDELLAEHPTTGTLILSISGACELDSVVVRAREKGLSVLVGSSHATEILENGLPLAHCLRELFPEVDVLLFRSRVVAMSLADAATDELQAYGQEMGEHLLASERRRTA